jgi:hypothetical protein
MTLLKNAEYHLIVIESCTDVVKEELYLVLIMIQLEKSNCLTTGPCMVCSKWLFDQVLTSKKTELQIHFLFHFQFFFIFLNRVPLSYGDFDRQIYAAGYQKRQMFRACDVGFENAKKSTCLIQ